MASEVRLFHQVPHNRKGNFADIDSAKGAAAQAQNFQSDAIFSRLFVPVHIILLLERAQNVAGRTLWNLQLAADFRVAHPLRLLRHSLEHAESALDRNRWIFFLVGHSKSLW